MNHNDILWKFDDQKKIRGFVVSTDIAWCYGSSCSHLAQLAFACQGSLVEPFAGWRQWWCLVAWHVGWHNLHGDTGWSASSVSQMPNPWTRHLYEDIESINPRTGLETCQVKVWMITVAQAMRGCGCVALVKQPLQGALALSFFKGVCCLCADLSLVLMRNVSSSHAPNASDRGALNACKCSAGRTERICKIFS